MRIVLGIIVLLVLAVGFWLGSANDHGAPIRPAATTAEATESPPEPVATASTADAEPQQRAPLEAPAVESDQFLYRVRVEHDDTGQPVAAAVVRWLPQDQPLSDEDRALQRQDAEALLAKLGKTATTGADGRTTILGPRQGVSVMARRDALFGALGMMAQEFRPDGPPATIALDTEFVIKMREDRTLIARAIDGAGRPVAGTHIALHWSVTTADGAIDRWESKLDPTDAEGLTRHRHIQDLHKLPESVTLVARLIGGRCDPTAVDLEPMPEQPIDVRLPAFGSLDVALLDADGRPWPTPPGHPGVSITTVNGSPLDSMATPHGLRFDDQGKATATSVLCGREFVLAVSGGAMIERKITGPQRAGERVAVELRVSADLPIVIARVIDAGGAPVVGRVGLQASTRRSTTFTATTTDGRLRAALSDRLLAIAPTITLTRRDEHGQPTGEQASVALRAPLVPGINDLGDITLLATPLLIAGRVQWPDGSAVEPPGIRFERTRDNATDRWEGASDLRIEFPGDGRFVARGASDGRRWRAQVEGNFVPQTLEFAAGTADLVIRVEKGASLVAHFLFDEAAPWQDLEYRLLPAAYQADPLVPQSSQRGRAMAEFRDGRISCGWGTLGAGPHRLTVECPGVEPPLVDLTIDVPRGATATDPRLQNIDLRGRLRSFAVTVTDVTGAPIQSNRAGVIIKGAETAEWYGRALGVEDGRAELFAHRPVDLLVFAAGFLTREVIAVFADTVVTLDTAPRIRILLATTPIELPEGTTMRLDCWPEGKRSWPQYRFLQRELTLGADGTAEIVPGSGSPLQLSLYLRRGRRSAPVAVQPETLDPQTVSQGEVVELRVEPEALRKAIEALGKD